MNNLWNIWWNQWTWPLKLGTLAAIAILLLIVFFSFKSCFKPKSAKVDIETANKINTGNAAEVRQQVRDMVEENAEVATTVDNRTTIAETNVVERNRLIEEKVKAIDQKIAEAKSNGEDITQEKLQCLLVPSDCQ